jgi:hypothetical protein
MKGFIFFTLILAGLILIGCGDEEVTAPDTTKPTVTITFPADGDTVLGTITITVTATDNVAVEEVHFEVDTTDIGEDATLPYEMSWNTTTFTNGSHIVKAEAHDSSENTEEAEVTVIVNN